jgi:hypothetical protein
MLIKMNRVMAIAVISALVAAASIIGTSAAQKDSAPKPQNKLALGEDQVKQLLLLMETDPEGKVSKQQYMKFMEAEFERLDRDKNGQLDVKALTHATTLTAARLAGK